MFENRRHFRLREFIDVTWKVEELKASGEGTIVNISSSGLLLQTDHMFRPADNCVVSIGSGEDILPFGAKKGKIAWFRRIHTPQERLQCGIQFLADDTDIKFEQWLEEKVNRLSDASDARILGNFAY